MSFTYRTSTVAPGEGEIHDVWGYKFRWTDKHQTEEEMKPLLYSYDILGAQVLDRVQANKVANGKSVVGPSGREDLLETVKAIALTEEDEVVNNFWEEVNSTPEWVDWEQIKRGQEIFYRYGEAMLVGLTFSSLLGGMGAARIVETLSRTGGFAPRVGRKRLLETTQHLLQCTASLDSIKPGGDGWIDCLRVRLLHAAVRKRILTLATTKPEYYDVEAFGTPINDQDTIATIATYSAQVIWLALPAQGIYLKQTEIEDYIHLWRLIAYYMGTPTDVFESVESTKAYMDSVLEADLKPSEDSKTLANNIITVLANQPPTYQSEDFLRAQARMINGPGLCDALDIPEASYTSSVLTVIQCLVICTISYIFRSIPTLDQRRIERNKKRYFKMIIEGKNGLEGKKTTYQLQYVPDFDTVTERGKLSKSTSDLKALVALALGLIIPLGAVYVFAKPFIKL